ncbi:MAG: DUF1588 domain-containing protein [Rhodospirillaceae bacterium]
MKSVFRSTRLFRTAASTACLLLGAVLASCSGSESVSEPKGAELAAVPAGIEASSPAQRRLITEQQYLNTVANIFGQDIEVIAQFAPMQRTDGLLALGASKAGVPSGELQKFQRAARQVAAQVVDNGNLELRLASHRDALIPCKPAAADKPDAACAEMFLRSTGRLLYRRPLSEARLAQMVSAAGQSTTQLGDFYAGIATVIEGMLISPEVLFIEDRTEPDPEHPGRQRLDAYSYASRLSFFLWNAAPDDKVLKAAESGELDTAKGRARVVDMMIASPRLEGGVRGFFDDMLGFDSFANLAKDPTAYPSETGATLADAREQTLRTIYDHLVTKKLDYRDLFTTRTTFMSPALGAIYRVPTTPGWTEYQFPANSPRVGILTQVSFLAQHAHPARSSPTRRGKALRELLLCQPVPLPPPNVDFSALENPTAAHRTQRDRVNFHLQNPVCAGCHKITDPIGLALENFDGAGIYRSTEKGVDIDASGALDGKGFTDIAGLAQAVRNHPSLPGCLVRRVYSYGTGTAVDARDKPLVDFLTAEFGRHGYRFPDLMRAIVLSPVFYDVTPPAPAEQKSAAASN